MNVPATVRREIVVATTPERAFELFTGRIGAWWPLARFSVFEQDNRVAFEDGRIVERADDGRESIWGRVTEWEPPSGGAAGSLAFTWHPGSGEEHATDVRVTFTASGDETLVSLVHTGWERTSDPFARAGEYDTGWPTVLAGFAALVAAS